MLALVAAVAASQAAETTWELSPTANVTLYFAANNVASCSGPIVLERASVSCKKDGVVTSRDLIVNSDFDGLPLANKGISSKNCNHDYSNWPVEKPAADSWFNSFDRIDLNTLISNVQLPDCTEEDKKTLGYGYDISMSTQWQMQPSSCSVTFERAATKDPILKFSSNDANSLIKCATASTTTSTLTTTTTSVTNLIVSKEELDKYVDGVISQHKDDGHTSHKTLNYVAAGLAGVALIVSLAALLCAVSRSRKIGTPLL